MVTHASANASRSVVKPYMPFYRRRTVLLFGTAVIVLLIGALGVGGALNWPFTRQRLIDALQESSVRSVTIGSFRQTWFPPGCVAETVNFLHRKHKNNPPLISIQKLVVQGSYWGLVGSPKRLIKVEAIGMHVTVPPSNPDGSNPVMPLTNVKSARPIVIGTIQADGAVLDFVSRTGEKTFELVIDKLSLDGVGYGQQVSYRAKLTNTNPPSDIQSAGRFGPWNSDDPGRTPLEATYRLENANLGFYKDISGVLNASGTLSGQLDHTHVTGQAEVPDFHVIHSAHTLRLKSKFDATVNGTDGNVALTKVESLINQTLVVASGSIAAQPGQKGKTVSLALGASEGRVEDLVDLFVSAKRPPMTGIISLKAKVDVPPGSANLLEKLNLDGDFGIAAAKFTNPATELPIRKLAQSGEKSKQAAELPTAQADLKGHVSARRGIATLENVSFTIEDGDARIHGSYGLESERVDLHGILRTSGKIYVTNTGFKALLLRALTPFLKHRSQMTFVPFKITGTYPDANISLDLLAKK
jgi:hypothetical protein